MNPIFPKVLTILLYGGILFLGCPLLIGLVDFERNGQDPLKRNLIDMVRNLIYLLKKRKKNVKGLFLVVFLS